MNEQHSAVPTETQAECSPMDAETLTALRGSIAKWQAIVDGTGADLGPDNCTLCQTFPACEGCPVAEAVDDTGCSRTPFEDSWGPIAKMGKDKKGYWAESPEQKAAALLELNFLKSLLPPGVES